MRYSRDKPYICEHTPNFLYDYMEEKTMSKSKMFIKMISMVLVVVTAFSVMTVSASAASWRTGNIPSNYRNSGYTTVRLNSTRSSAKIKIHAYHTLIPNGKGYEGNSRLYITMRDTSGRWIWGGEINTGRSGKTMTLGKDHSAYRIQIREVKLPGIKYYENYWHPTYWGIECTKNCYI